MANVMASKVGNFASDQQLRFLFCFCVLQATDRPNKTFTGLIYHKVKVLAIKHPDSGYPFISVVTYAVHHVHELIILSRSSFASMKSIGEESQKWGTL